MQVVNKKMCVVVILVLVIIESCTLFLMYKSYGNRNTNLDEVNLNKEINNNMFAIMLEQSDGTYKEDTSNIWPTSGYTYNESMSGCIDINGNKIEDALTYDKESNKASVNTTNTSYCYLYFSIPKWCNEDETASECLLRNPTRGLVTTSIQGGMYRYQGAEYIDNYICFGYNNYEENCDFTNATNSDLYAYRIIGINEEFQLKVIKKEALNTEYAWHSSNSNVDWNESSLYNGLNGNYFINNDNYILNSWKDKIAVASWKYGTIIADNIGSNNSSFFETGDGEIVYQVENAFNNQINAKVSSLTVSDYFYAFPGGKMSDSNAIPSWIHLSHNDTNAPSSYEWTMIKEGQNPYTDVYSAWMFHHMDNSFYSVMNDVTSKRSVRPVFYIINEIKITNGAGTFTDPFIIK